MDLRVASLLLAAAAAGVAACSRDPAPSSDAPASQPSSQPSSLPAGHSTSTTAMDLDGLFRPPESLPEVVATVDGQPVSRSAFEQELRQLQLELAAAGVPSGLKRSEVLQSALNRCSDRILQSLLAAELEVSVNPDRVKAWLDGLELRIGADPAFAAFLLRAGKDAEQRQKDAKNAVEFEAIVDALRDEVAESLEDKARDYYDRHPQDHVERAGIEVWRIFLKAPRGMVQRDRDLVRARAEDVLEKAKADPERFETLARNVSDGGKANSGGYLGFVPEGVFPAALYEQIQAAKPGEVLDMWEDAVGFTVHKVGKSRKERIIPFEEAQPKIVEVLFGPTVQREVEARLEALRAKRPVEIQAPSLRSLLGAG